MDRRRAPSSAVLAAWSRGDELLAVSCWLLASRVLADELPLTREAPALTGKPPAAPGEGTTRRRHVSAWFNTGLVVGRLLPIPIPLLPLKPFGVFILQLKLARRRLQTLLDLLDGLGRAIRQSPFWAMR